MKTFFDLAQTRRSTRTFKPDAVPQQIQEELQKIVLMSPANKRTNPWDFIFVEDKEMLKSLSECKNNGGAFVKDCPLAVVVVADTQKTDLWIENTAVATTYLLLAAEDLGLGSCWVQIRKRQTDDGEQAGDIVKRLLNIPESYEVLSIVALGYKDGERKPFDLSRLQLERIHKETF